MLRNSLTIFGLKQWTQTTCQETQYELWKGINSNFKFFHVIGSKCYILADREQKRKMDPKSDEGIIIVYSINSIAYRVYNKCVKAMMESINVVVYDIPKDKEWEEDEVPTQQLMSQQMSHPRCLTLCLRSQILMIFKSTRDHQS